MSHMATHYEAARWTLGHIRWSWLDYQIPDHAVIDLWRYALTLGCFFLIGAGLWYAYQVREHGLIVISVAINSLVGGFVILQEVQQYGRPMLVWRLPYETVLVALCVVSVRRSRKLRDERSLYGRTASS